MLFYIVNGFLGTVGGYLMFKKFRHLGLLAAGAALTVGSVWSMGGEQWWPMLASLPVAVVLYLMIGDPAEG
jgi:hypothetical protein